MKKLVLLAVTLGLVFTSPAMAATHYTAPTRTAAVQKAHALHPAKARSLNGYCGTGDGGFGWAYGLLFFDRWAGDSYVITPGADPNATGVWHLVGREYWIFTYQYGFTGGYDHADCWIFW